mmetsp:Transcript_24785/g.69600  ORF Transcript_24785/g.69600 Transcript_24785/m.69600 type:complete len:91 (-) Transcript_24785:249-521(-)
MKCWNARRCVNFARKLKLYLPNDEHEKAKLSSKWIYAFTHHHSTSTFLHSSIRLNESPGGTKFDCRLDEYITSSQISVDACHTAATYLSS